MTTLLEISEQEPGAIWHFNIALGSLEFEVNHMQFL